MLQDHETPLEERLNYVQLALAYLKSLAGDARADTGWAPPITHMLGVSLSSRSQRLPPMYNRSNQQYTVASNLAELHQRRDALHRELCEQMLKMPELARAGFTYLLATAEADGQVFADRENRAEEGSQQNAESEEAKKTSEGPQESRLGSADFVRYATDLLLREASGPVRQATASVSIFFEWFPAGALPNARGVPGSHGSG